MCGQDGRAWSSIDNFNWSRCLICCARAWCRDDILTLPRDIHSHDGKVSSTWPIDPAFKDWRKSVVGNDQEHF